MTIAPAPASAMCGVGLEAPPKPMGGSYDPIAESKALNLKLWGYVPVVKPHAWWWSCTACGIPQTVAAPGQIPGAAAQAHAHQDQHHGGKFTFTKIGTVDL